MRLLVAAFLLASCGAYHDPLLDEDLAAIRQGFSEASGQELPEVFSSVVSDSRIERLRLTLRKNLAAVFLPEERLVVMPTREWWADHFHPRIYRASFAHEIGHALGLEHREDGLMAERGDPTCVGREGQCLWEAFQKGNI